MPIVSPQQNITQTLTLSRAQILTLHSVPFVLVPAETGYINVFQKASVSNRYKNSVFTNVNHLLSFKTIPTVGSPVLVSNSLNATNILGISQSTTISFDSANPYSQLMSLADNAPLVFTIEDSDPTGGDPASALVITFIYSIFQLS